MTTLQRTLAALAGSTALACLFAADPALADPITYNVSEPVGSGTVTGTITTDGVIGTLAVSDITDWTLNVNGSGSTITLNHANSVVIFGGTDLTATTTELKFNFSGSDNGYLGFQSTNPGAFSGFHYACFSADATNFVCRHGESVVPGQFSDPSSQFADRTGNQVIASNGTAGNGPPTTGNAQFDRLIASLEALGDSRAAQMLLFQLQSYQLMGLNEQVSCGNCGGVGLGFGSFAVSAHGRHALNDDWTVLGGVDYGQYRQQGADVDMNAGFAVGLQFDPWRSMGSSRPYAEAGVSAATQRTSYNRDYDTATGSATGAGRTRNTDISAFAEAGWVARLTPADEGAVYLIASRTWQRVRGYAEATGAANPFNAVVPGGQDVTDTLGVHAQFTHLLGRRVEAGLNGGVDRVFQRRNGLSAQLGGISVDMGERPSFLTGEVGVRLGLRLMPRMTLDLTLNDIIAPGAIGSSVHGGVGARWAF